MFRPHCSRTLIRSGLVLAVAILAPGSPTSAQEEQSSPQPTAEHELLQKDVGTWDADIKIWTEPDADPMESKGSEKSELLGNGMWLVSHFEGTIAGMPFEGAGAFGYDPTEKKYVGTWVDTMSPYLLTIKGDYDAGAKTMTSMAEGRDPATVEVSVSKMVSRYIDDDTRTFEIQMKGDDGEYRKMMEIVYKRAK
jgi:hypothetical protein